MTCIKRTHSLWTTCPCPDCTIARRRLSKHRNAGLYRRVASEEAWAIIAARFADGWTAAAVGSACGLSVDSFSRHHAEWRRGNTVYIGPITAQRVVNMGDPTAGQVGATGTRRRLRALARMGYGLATLSELSGVQFSTLAMARSRNERVRASIAVTIRDLYDQIHMTPGGDTQAARQAAEKGWSPPLAWDNPDDPAERPAGHRTQPRRKSDIDEVVVQRLLDGQRVDCTTAERNEAMRRWKKAGKPERDLCQRLGWHDGRYGREVA